MLISGARHPVRAGPVGEVAGGEERGRRARSRRDEAVAVGRGDESVVGTLDAAVVVGTLDAAAAAGTLDVVVVVVSRRGWA